MSLDPTVRTYDPNKITCTFGGVTLVGFASGTFLTIARNGNRFEKDRGADGTVDRINKNANDFLCTFTLKQTSITNDELSEISNQDSIDNSGVKPLQIKDLNGTTLFNAEQSWIEKDPDDEFSDSLSTRPWAIATGPASKVTGGNL